VQGTQIALEGVRSIKVVSAYSLQQDVCKRYSKVLPSSLHYLSVPVAFIMPLPNINAGNHWCYQLENHSPCWSCLWLFSGTMAFYLVLAKVNQ